MFSVDNFYTIFNSYYGWPVKNNALCVFHPHGSKDWEDCSHWGSISKLDDYDRLLKGAFLMHDQEPFDIKNAVHSFTRFGDKNNLEYLINLRPDKEYHYRVWAGYLDGTQHDIQDVEIMSLIVRTTSIPIICHSEKNSKDIQHLEQNNWISCYYWWHGMIARDWFRHWHRHNALSTRNKSTCNYRFLIYSRDHTGTRKYRNEVIEHLKQYQSKTNYNWLNDDRCSSLSATIDVSDANNSAIHLVAETLFDTDKIHLTEKVFKPMVMCQPFILFAPPGSLQYLREYGFKTFEDCWDESYDQIKDSSERMKKIQNLIDYLAALNDQDFFTLYEKMLPIIEHNRRRFYSEDFQTDLWNELQKNCSDALLKQQELSKQLPGGTWLYYLNQIYNRTGYCSKLWTKSIEHILKNNNVKIDTIQQMYPRLLEYYQCQ